MRAGENMDYSRKIIIEQLFLSHVKQIQVQSWPEKISALL